MQEKPDGLVLFSGGLDSLLAALLLRGQGLKIRCLHFTSPFFGSEANVAKWRNQYGLDITAVDATEPFVKMLANRPPHDTGKVLNPCLDCKIILLRLARKILEQTGARFLATGEVRGQRPMSQRPDAMNIVLREAGVKDLLLRPLSAQLLPPTPVEECGLVDRTRLLRISGRGRLEQLSLARTFGITDIPTPGGGCRLTEHENARRYWPILKRCWEKPDAAEIPAIARDFRLANLGRMLLRGNSGSWLCVGRNQRDNEAITAAAARGDVILRLPFPGPLALAIQGASWPAGHVEEAGCILAGFSSRAREAIAPVKIRALAGSECQEFSVVPNRLAGLWFLPSWEQTRAEIKAWRKMAAASLLPTLPHH